MNRSLLLALVILGLTMAITAVRPSLKEAEARGRVLFQASNEYGGSGYVDDDAGIIDDIGDLFGSPSPASTGVDQEENNDGVSFWYVAGILTVSVVALVIVVAIIGGVIVAGAALYKKKQQKKSSSDNFDYIQMGPDIPTEIN
eukprot:CAMPEP_0184353994 /NCGR_PEP_ID=MMETSP1089-20130417/84379_1 /TAXON_ID=38269 ORGANISM="Gloeochaete wittrockiana, Strain SAG46.84" /NCGR_SAMPLE_ID=MMETSP1089 /ASSEMBLY_ACC=CAM_ASM_000445 /LENGTH=142 /DNA_ID=CAMNT_0026689755 /DNA_START=11 /DNA_END=439 /DNA_ORIENTATION=-